MDISLSADAIILYEKALDYAISLNDKYLRTSHFLYIALTEEKYLQNILIHLNINIDDLVKDVKKVVDKNITDNKNNEVVILHEDFIMLLSYTVNDVWYSYEIINHIMLVENECLSILFKHKVNQKKLNNAFITYRPVEEVKQSNTSKENVKSPYLVNLGKNAKKCYGRDETYKTIFRVLNRTKKKNIILVGEAGVGKTQIAEGLAYKLSNNEVPISLLDYQVVSLNIFDLLNENNFKGDLEFKLNNIIKSLSNKNIILFIDEIHLLGEKHYNVFNLLKPFLSSDKISVIGCTTNQEYNENIEKHKSITRRFEIVNVLELNDNEVFEIIKNNNKNIDDEAIINVIKYSKNFKNTQNPDKSLELVDDINAFYKAQNYVDKKYIDVVNDINKIQKEKSAILNNGKYGKSIELKNKEKELNQSLTVLKNNNSIKIDATLLDDYLTQNNLTIKPIDYKSVINKIKGTILGQNKALNSIKNSLLINEIFQEKNKSFLLIGNTGVGKTQFVKDFAKEINYKLVRIDGGDYGDKYSVSNLIGSPFGYVDSDTEPAWLTTIKSYGKVVLLFDEFEKSHMEIQNIFLRILDEKEYQYKTNNIIDFSNVYIFFTSNAGIRDSNIGFSESTFKPNLKNFKAEFLTRVSNIVVFENLKQEDILQITKNEINQLAANTLIKDIVPLIDVEELVNNVDFNKTGVRGLKQEIKKTILKILND